MTTTAHEPLLRAREAAHELGIHPETLRRAVRDGRVPAVRLGERGHLHFRRKDLGLLPVNEAAIIREATEHLDAREVER